MPGNPGLARAQLPKASPPHRQVAHGSARRKTVCTCNRDGKSSALRRSSYLACGSYRRNLAQGEENRRKSESRAGVVSCSFTRVVSASAETYEGRHAAFPRERHDGPPESAYSADPNSRQPTSKVPPSAFPVLTRRVHNGTMFSLPLSATVVHSTPSCRHAWS